LSVYDDCHLGHARTFVAFDMIVRYLRYKGFTVNYVRNITDVDDKIIARAREEGLEPHYLTANYIKRMHEDFLSLGMIEPDFEPKATKHIPDIINLISNLISKDYAYYNEGNVYFSVKSFSQYGKLSKRNVDDMEAGARVDIDLLKRNPADFILINQYPL
jgi:cysteinyl-tRNA synthetase